MTHMTPEQERIYEGAMRAEAEQQSAEAAMTWFTELDFDTALEKLIAVLPEPVYLAAVQEVYDNYLISMAEAQAESGGYLA